MGTRSFFAGCLLLPVLAMAQPGPPDAPPGDSKFFDRIEKLKKVRLIELLELSEDQSVRFFARFNEHESTRRQLYKERGMALDRIDRLIWNKADAGEFDKAFNDVFAFDTRIADDQRSFLSGLSDILTIQQRAKLLTFERRFEKELREAMRDAQRRRHAAPDDQP